MVTYTEPGQIEGQLAAATRLWVAGLWRQLLATSAPQAQPAGEGGGGRS
jgi:hypothetical protein